MPRKFTFEFVKEYIEKEGWTLLSTEYKDTNTKLELICDKGHRADKRFSNFKRGIRCGICDYNNWRTSYEVVKKFIEDKGWTLLSTEFKNIHTKLEMKCPQNHIRMLRYGDFKSGTRCKICTDDNNRTNYNDVKQLVENKK